MRSIPIYAASEIVVDSSASSNNQAKLDKSNNDVTIVNISGELSNAGVSHNKFTKFNVGTEGVVINNSTEFGMSALTGEALYNNPLLNQGAAKVILNEVTGGNVSSLLGYTEIFGAKADYIFASPKGITCNGCGFINVDRLSMITGSSNSVNGELAGFNLGDGILSIGAGGLDASTTSSAELVTRIADITGMIIAGSELNIKTGNEYYNYKTGAINSVPRESNNSHQGGALFSVDASEFGSMYAGKIKIIATEAGFGVRSASNMASSVSDLMITADGDITYKNIASEGNIQLASGNDIEQTGQAYSNGEIELTAGRDITLGGDYIYSEGVNLTAGNELNIDSGIYGFDAAELLAKDVNIGENGEIISRSDSSGKLTISATDSISNKGLIGVVSEIEMSANQLTNDHQIYSRDKLNITASQLTNNAMIISDSNLQISADILDNQASLISNDVLTITAGDITSDTIYSIGEANISSNNLTNNNIIQSESTLNILASSIINSGTVLANAALNVIADLFTNEGSLLALGNSDIASSEIDNRSGKILLLGENNQITADNFNNSGTRDLAAEAIDLAQGLIVTGDLTSSITNLDNGSGNIYINGTANLGALNNNDGFVHLASGVIGQKDQALRNINGEIEIGNAGYVQIHTSGIEGEGGVIGGYGSLSILSGANELALSGDISVGGLFSISHYLASEEELEYESSFLSIINGGNLYGGEGLYITANELTNTGNLISGFDIGLDVSDDITNQGGVYAVSSLYSDSANFINQGEMVSGADMIIQTEEALDNSDGSIITGGDFIYDGKILKNRNGELLAYGETYVKNLQNEYGYFYSGGGGIVDNINIKHIDAQGFDTTEFTEEFSEEYYDQIKGFGAGGGSGERAEDYQYANGTWSSTALESLGNGMIYNRGGIIESGSGLLTLQGRDLDYHENGQIIGEGGISLEIDESRHTILGDISVGGLFAISRYGVGKLDITNMATLYGGEGLYIEGSRLDNKGVLLSADDMNIQISDDVVNHEGSQIYSEGNILIEADNSFHNLAGSSIISDGDMEINIASNLTNKADSRMESGGTMSLSGINLYNDNYIKSGGDMSLLFDGRVDNKSYDADHEAKILSYGDLFITARDGSNIKDIYNRWSRIASKGDMLLAVDNLKNDGRDFTNGNLSISYTSTGAWANNNTVIKGYQTLTSSNVYTDYAEILSGGSMIITGDNLTNRAGRIYADGSLTQNMSGTVLNDYLSQYSVTLNTDYHQHWRTGGGIGGHDDHHRYYSTENRNYTYTSRDGSEIISGGHDGYLGNFEGTHIGSPSLATTLPATPGGEVGGVDPTSGGSGSPSVDSGNNTPDMESYKNGLGMLNKNFAELKAESLDVKRNNAKQSGKLELTVIDPNEASYLFALSASNNKPNIEQLFTEAGLKVETREDGQIDLALGGLTKYQSDYGYLGDGEYEDDLFKRDAADEFIKHSYREYSDEEKAAIIEQLAEEESKRKADTDKAISQHFASFNHSIELASFNRNNIDQSSHRYPQYSYVPADSKNMFTGLDESGLTILAKNIISNGGEISSDAGDLALIADDDISLTDTQIASASSSNIIAGGDISITKSNNYSISNVGVSIASVFASTLDAATDLISGLSFNSASDIQIAASGDLTIDTDYLNSGGSIYMDAGGDLTNSNHQINASDDVVMNASNIYNKHVSGGAATKIIAGDVAYLNATGDIENAGAEISAGSLAYLNAGGNITNKSSVATTISGNNVTEELTKGSINSEDMLVLNAGGNIINQGADIIAGGDVSLIAGADIDIKTESIYKRIYKTFTGGYEDTKTWTQEQSNITSGGNLAIASSGAVGITGSNLSATGDLDIEAEDGITIAAAENKADYKYHWQSKKKWGSRKYVDKREITTEAVESNLSGDNINISNTNTGDITLTAAQLAAVNAINITAADGDVNIENGYDSSYKEEKTKRARGWASAMFGEVASSFGDKKRTKTEEQTKYTVVASNVTAGTDINIDANNVGSTLAGAQDGNINITASNITSTTGNINLTADKDINLKIAKDTSLHTVKEESETLMWFRNHDRGSYDETLKFSELSAESGSVNIAAARDINIEIAAAEEVDAKSNVYFPLEGKSDGGRSPAPEGGQNLASTSNLNLSGNVTYNEVTEAHDNWNEETEGLTEVGAAVVAVAAAVVTGGAAGTMASGLAAGAGAGATAATVTGVSVGAMAGAASSQIAVSTVNNKGDLGQVVDDLDQGEFYEGIAIAGATAALTAGLTSGVESLNFIPQGNISNSVRDSIVTSAVESSINGDSFSESLEAAALNAAVSTTTKTLANQIGDMAHDPINPIGKPVQLTLHAAVGCASGAAISGSCAGGAAGAVAGELIAEGTSSSGYSRERSLQFAEIGSAIAGGIVGGDADSVYAGSKAGRNAGENNFWRHEIRDEMMMLDNLEGRITNEELQIYQDHEVANAESGLKLMGVMAAPAAFASSGILNGVTAIHGTSGALNGAWGSYVSGGDAESILASSAIGSVAAVVVGKVPYANRVKSVFDASIRGATIASTSAIVGSSFTTMITSKDPTWHDYAKNAKNAALITFISGYASAPITYVGKGSAASNFSASVHGLFYDALGSAIVSDDKDDK